MKIEGNRLIFSTGKEVRIDGNIMGLCLSRGDIAVGNLIIPEPYLLADGERWELAKYMAGRWAALAKKIWDKHEATMYQAPVETKEKPLGDILEEAELPIWRGIEQMDGSFREGHYITKEHTAELVKISEDIAEAAKEARQRTGEAILTDEEANKELTKIHPCPQCTSDTIIGMHRREDGKGWDIVEPRYCPVCDWKDKKPEGPPNETVKEYEKGTEK